MWRPLLLGWAVIISFMHLCISSFVMPLLNCRLGLAWVRRVDFIYGIVATHVKNRMSCSNGSSRKIKKVIVKFDGKCVLLNVLHLNFRCLILYRQVKCILTALQSFWSCCSQKCVTETWIIFFWGYFGERGGGEEKLKAFLKSVGLRILE